MIHANRKKTLLMALLAGEIMLKNGAETYRVEDTIVRLCKSRNFPYVDAYVTPTGIFVTMDSKGEDHEEIVTYIRRIKSRSINLNKVTEVNNFSRNFVESQMSLDMALATLRDIDNLKPYSRLVTSFLGGGLAGAFVALLYGGNFPSFLATILSGFLVAQVAEKANETEFPSFLSNILGGMVAAICAIILSYMSTSISVGIVITGSIMSLLPGVAITNAVRDSIDGDLVSGLARAVEAVIVATSIAVGVGIILKTWQILLGGSIL